MQTRLLSSVGGMHASSGVYSWVGGVAAFLGEKMTWCMATERLIYIMMVKAWRYVAL